MGGRVTDITNTGTASRVSALQFMNGTQPTISMAKPTTSITKPTAAPKAKVSSSASAKTDMKTKDLKGETNWANVGLGLLQMGLSFYGQMQQVKQMKESNRLKGIEVGNVAKQNIFQSDLTLQALNSKQADKGSLALAFNDGADVKFRSDYSGYDEKLNLQLADGSEVGTTYNASENEALNSNLAEIAARNEAVGKKVERTAEKKDAPPVEKKKEKAKPADDSKE